MTMPNRELPTPTTPPRAGAAPPPVDSRELLRGAREIVIRHGDQEYRLRHTQNDKLILTK
jgi:hemin uptake protein HemP